MRIQSFSINPGRWALVVGLIVFTPIAAVYLVQNLESGNYKELIIFSSFGLAASLSLFVLRNWRVGVVAFFMWIAVEDLVRKYLGNALIIYGIKDLMILATYTSYFLAGWGQKQEGFKNPLKVPLLLWFGWAGAEALNPNISNWLVPIMGLRMSFFYVPMLYLGYAFFKNEQQLRGFLILILSIAMLVSLLGIVQAIVGLDFLNPESARGLRLDMTRVELHLGVEVRRPTSTFVDPGRFALYLFAIIYLGLGLLGYLYTSHQAKHNGLRRLIWFCWITVLVGLFVSGQRASMLWLIVSLPLLGLAYVYERGGLRKMGRSLPLTRFLLAGPVALLLLGLVFRERFEFDSRYYVETMNPASYNSVLGLRSADYWNDITRAISSGGLIGHGTGTASLGLQYVYDVDPYTDGRSLIWVEGGYAAVLWEWGLIGLILWLWWSVTLMWKLVQKIVGLRGTPLYWLSIGIVLNAFFTLFAWFYLGMQIYQNYTTQAFLWFTIGLLFNLPTLLFKGESATPGAAFGLPLLSNTKVEAQLSQ